MFNNNKKLMEMQTLETIKHKIQYINVHKYSQTAYDIIPNALILFIMVPYLSTRKAVLEYSFLPESLAAHTLIHQGNLLLKK